MTSGIYKRTEETKRKISETHKGKYPTIETKRKMSLIRKGKTYEKIFGQEKANEIKKKMSIIKIGNKNPAKRLEVRKKISLALKGIKRKPFTLEHKNNMSLARKGIKFTEKHKKQLIKSWNNEKRRNKTIQASLKAKKILITTNEKKLLKIIQENKLPFNFVGDGKVVFNGFCPDFLSKNPKHIIELFGEGHYDKNHKKRDKQKLRIYSSLGYKTLIIYNRELNNKNKVIEKIKEFIK